MKLIKCITLATALALATDAYSSEKPPIPEKAKELLSLFTGNLVCGMYGKYSTDLEAPHFPHRYFDMSKNVLEKLFSYDEVRNRSKITEPKFYEGMKSAILARYKKEGPAGLKVYVNEVMTDDNFTQPKWINKCEDLLSYSNTFFETNIGSN